jgi:hypothetical protein
VTGGVVVEFVACAIIAESAETPVPPFPSTTGPFLTPPPLRCGTVTPPPPPPAFAGSGSAGEGAGSFAAAAVGAESAGAGGGVAGAAAAAGGAAVAGAAALVAGVLVADGAAFGGRVRAKIIAATAASRRPAATGMTGLPFACAAGLVETGRVVDGGVSSFPDAAEVGGSLAELGDGLLCDGGGGIDGVSSSKRGAEASAVVFARSSAAGSTWAIDPRSTMPESCSWLRTAGGGGVDGFEEEGGDRRDDAGLSEGELASLASSCRLLRSRWEGGPPVLLIVGSLFCCRARP